MFRATNRATKKINSQFLLRHSSKKLIEMKFDKRKNNFESLGNSKRNISFLHSLFKNFFDKRIKFQSSQDKINEEISESKKDNFIQGGTPLHHVKTGQDVAKFIKNGIDINSLDEHGRTPLHYAKNIEIVKALLDAKANDKAIDIHGRIPLHYAKEKDIAELLARNLNGRNIQDNNGCTPLHYATHTDIFYSIVKFKTIKSRFEEDRDIVYNGELIRTADKFGRYPIHYATSGSMVECLLVRNHGVGRSIRDKFGCTPLHYAKTPFVIMELTRTIGLFHSGADCNAVNIYNQTPLHYAKDEIIAAFLIEKGAEPNFVDKQGCTPLHYAKSVALINVLIKAGANPNAVNNAGCVPLDYAHAPEVIEALVKHGAKTKSISKIGSPPLEYPKIITPELFSLEDERVSRPIQHSKLRF